MGKGEGAARACLAAKPRQSDDRFHRLGVEILPYLRLYGADAEDAYFQHVLSGEPVMLEGVDTLVTSLGHQPVATLADALSQWPGELHLVGDCLTPRTVEEAVFEGLKAGAAL